MTHQDSDLFLQQMADVKPLKQDAVQKQGTNAKQALNSFYKQQADKQLKLIKDSLDQAQIKYVEPDDYIAYKSPGLQAGVFKNLRLAKYDIEGKIELQGLSINDAKEKLLYELTQCQKRNIRVVLIKHGIGIENKTQPAKLKSHINTWLTLFPFVLGFHTAQTQHGGYGSTYVLLTKNEQAKLTNREIHAKK